MLVPGAGGLSDEVGDRGSDIGTPCHREAAALAEIVLHVYDDQGAAHGWVLTEWPDSARDYERRSFKC
ncbi:hypothetical protein GCM10010431_71760 [Streptomyces kunmingensis]